MNNSDSTEENRAGATGGEHGRMNGAVEEEDDEPSPAPVVTSSEPETKREEKDDKQGEVEGASSNPTAGGVSQTSEEEEGDMQVELLQLEGSSLPSSPLQSEPDALPGNSEHQPQDVSPPMPTSTSGHHGNAMATTTSFKRAISPIWPPENNEPFTTSATASSLSPASSPHNDDTQHITKEIPPSDNKPRTAATEQAPPTVAQNRLPVGKSGFDRHHQSRKLLGTHKQQRDLLSSVGREEKSLAQVKKWTRPTEPGSRGHGGLFDVDPQEGVWRGKPDGRGSGGDREPVKPALSEGRKGGARPSSQTHLSSRPATGERSKYTSSNRPRGEEPPTRHSRPLEPHPGGVWEAGSGKPKSRSAPRQGSRFSPATSDLCPPDLTREREDAPDDDSSRGRGKMGGGFQSFHGVWREDHQPPTTDHARERSHSKHKLHRTDPSKSGFDHGRKMIRTTEKEQRKHLIDEEDRGAAAVFKRHRPSDDDSDHAAAVRLKHGSRKRSYESISEEEVGDEMSGTRGSSRESSLVAEDRLSRGDRRSSQEVGSGGESVRWRKEGKRPGENLDDMGDFARLKHKKHKHGGKERKERRKWRKLAEGGGSGSGELKLKRSVEDKAWLGYHKH